MASLTDPMITMLLGIIIILVGYIGYLKKQREEVLSDIKVDQLLKRLSDSEQLLSRAKEQTCWRCGGQMVLDKANLYGENVLEMRCTNCGATMTWRGEKGEWEVATEVKQLSEQIKEKTEQLAAKVGTGTTQSVG